MANTIEWNFALSKKGVQGAPVQEDMMSPKSMEGEHEGREDVADLKPMCGFLCCMSSCYTKKDCFGCMDNCEFLCINSNSECCKMLPGGKEIEGDTVYCICNKGSCTIKKPETCIGRQSQCCCLDQRCAIPCNDENPCICTILPFCTVCAGGKVTMGCCKSLGEMGVNVKGADKDGDDADAKGDEEEEA